jgi:hypothetical protein
MNSVESALNKALSSSYHPCTTLEVVLSMKGSLIDFKNKGRKKKQKR